MISIKKTGQISFCKLEATDKKKIKKKNLQGM